MLSEIQAHQRATRPMVYEELDVGGAAIGFQKLPAELFKTEVVINEGPVRMTVTGEAPDAALGVLGLDTDRLVLNAHEATRFLAIRTGVTNGLLRAIHHVLALLVLTLVLAGRAAAQPPAASTCELDLSATSEYAAMLRDGRDGFERSAAALTAKLKAAEHDKQQLQAKVAALEKALEAAKKPAPASEKKEGP